MVPGGGGGQSLGLLAVQCFKIIEAEFYNYFYKFDKTYCISRFYAEYWLVGKFVDTFEWNIWSL